MQRPDVGVGPKLTASVGVHHGPDCAAQREGVAQGIDRQLRGYCSLAGRTPSLGEVP
jgi:hypothetical protein